MADRTERRRECTRKERLAMDSKGKEARRWKERAMGRKKDNCRMQKEGDGRNKGARRKEGSRADNRRCDKIGRSREGIQSCAMHDWTKGSQEGATRKATTSFLSLTVTMPQASQMVLNGWAPVEFPA